MTVAANDREVLLLEHGRLMVQQIEYYQTIVATARLALACAAAMVAFLYTDLPSFAAGQARLLALLPAAIIVLAALRCLSIHLVMRAAADDLRTVKTAFLADASWGFHRGFLRSGYLPPRSIEVITASVSALATVGALLFWLAFWPVDGM